MISMFRNFFQSKIGLPIFIGFLIIVALAFAASDISGSSTFGGLTGDDKLAVVGDDTISANEMNGAMSNALDRARDQNPTITMPQFVAGGGLEGELDLLIERYGVGQFAQLYGLRAGDNLVNSEILKIGAFRGPTGEFDQTVYQNALRRQGITDAILRRDIGDGLLAQQILRPAFAAPQMPEAAARQYAALVLERRQGQIGLIPSLDFAPEDNPSDEQLNTFYSDTQSDYILPERRTVRFAAFGAESVSADIAPTPTQIAARFERDADVYGASERRAISSFVVPTEAAAQALVTRIRGGVSLEAAAAEAGFQVSAGGLLNAESMASSLSFAVSEAAFAASEGDILTPAQSTLGWYVARLDDIDVTPARTLAQASDEISQQLQQEALADALEELSSEIEQKVDTGTSLADVAEEFSLEINVVPGLTADGQIFGTPGQGVSPALRPILDTAFQMDESEPQLAELVPGAQFLIFDVEDIVESAAPPLAEVREQVQARWRLAEGNKLAAEAANRILEAVRNGASLTEAMRSENAGLTQVEDVNLRRTELLASQDRNIPPALVLLFSMAQGSTKVLEDGQDLGWYVVDLDTIETDSLEGNEELLAQTRQQLAPALVNEYNAQLARAIREEIGVERNEEAIEALRKTLAGES